MLQKVQLNLTIDEVNLILNSLGQQPYVEVQKLIDNIKQQSYSQLKQDEQRPPLSNQEEQQ